MHVTKICSRLLWRTNSSDTMKTKDSHNLLQRTFNKIVRKITKIFLNFIVDSIYIVKHFINYWHFFYWWTKYLQLGNLEYYVEQIIIATSTWSSNFYLREWISEWVSEWGIILYHQVSTCSAISWWEPVTFQWDEEDDIHCAFQNHT